MSLIFHLYTHTHSHTERCSECVYVRDIERVRSDTRMATPATQHTWNSMQWAWRIVNSFDTVTHTHTLARVWRVKDEKRELKHKMLMSMRAYVMYVWVSGSLKEQHVVLWIPSSPLYRIHFSPYSLPTFKKTCQLGLDLHARLSKLFRIVDETEIN